MSTSQLQSLIQPLCNADGSMTMLALDQRESLREMMTRPGAEPASDMDLVRFKQQALASLAEHASAVLVDRQYCIESGEVLGNPTATTVILAADDFVQPFGEPVKSSSLDDGITPELARSVDAKAIKFLALWTQQDSPARRAEVQRFLDLARSLGVASLLEGIVRPVQGAWSSAEERHDAIIDAAAELGGMKPDVYKAEVPGYVHGDLSRVTEESRRMTDVLGDIPWVVLSNGVHRDDFEDAVRAAVAGGASGFLAGRAVWSEATKSDDLEGALAIAGDRLRAFVKAAQETLAARSIV